MSSQNWINNFATLCPQQNINSNSTDIDNLFNNMEDENIIKMLELKGETISIINGREDFDLTEDEQSEIKISEKEEINDFINKVKNYIEKFQKLQTELNESNELFQKETEKLKKYMSTTDSMIEFIKKIPEEQKDQENVKTIIKQMDILSKNIMNNETMKTIRKNYVEKRKESENIIGLIRQLNQLNQTNICPLCFTKTVDHFIDPCGHTFCKNCLEQHLKINNEENDLNMVNNQYDKKCCFCRTVVRSAKPLYFI